MAPRQQAESSSSLQLQLGRGRSPWSRGVTPFRGFGHDSLAQGRESIRLVSVGLSPPEYLKPPRLLQEGHRPQEVTPASTLLPFGNLDRTVTFSALPGVVGLLAAIKEDRRAANIYLWTLIVESVPNVLLLRAQMIPTPSLDRLAWILVIMALNLSAVMVSSTRGCVSTGERAVCLSWGRKQVWRRKLGSLDAETRNDYEWQSRCGLAHCCPI